MPSEKLYEIKVKENYEKLDKIIKSIKEIIEKEKFPERNGSKKKCNDCEYRRFCNDCEQRKEKFDFCQNRGYNSVNLKTA